MSRVYLLAIWLLCLAASIVSAVWMFAAIVAGSDTRAWKLAVSHDQLANTAFGGDEDETISSRAGRAQRDGKRWACVFCKLLDKIDRNHCEKSIGQ